MLPQSRPYLDAIIDGAGGDIVSKAVKLLKVKLSFFTILCSKNAHSLSKNHLIISLPFLLELASNPIPPSHITTQTSFVGQLKFTSLANPFCSFSQPGGTIVSYGMTLAPTLPVPMSFVLSNLDLRTSTMGSRAEFRAMAAFVAETEIRPVVSRVVELNGGLDDEGALEKLEGLWGDMKAGAQFGKLVVQMDGGEGDGRGSRL
ncbi:hypothetical protein MMC30_002962 [Trapelia coarctata]|nr:hypothetical protein [Trapelia coarctata]